jgi:hypothetical protein
MAKETGHQESWQGARCDPWCWVVNDSRNVYAIAQTVIAAKFREVRSWECGFCPLLQNPLRGGSRKPLNLYGGKCAVQVFQKQMSLCTESLQGPRLAIAVRHSGGLLALQVYIVTANRR